MRVRNFRLLMILMAVGIMTIFSFPAMATDVGGIIDTDTTWDLAGSPYNIASTVQIDGGVTLTIDPGVVVIGHYTSFPFDIQVWGTLNAIGTDTLKITLNNVTISAGAQYTGTLNIQFAMVYSGSISPFGLGSPASLTILDSKIEDTLSCIYLYMPSSDCYIERNIFINSECIDTNTSTSVIYIRNNLFYEQKPSWAIISFSSNTGGIIVEYNSFLSTDRVALTVGGSDGQMMAINNFWNTDNTDIIESMIYDKNDDLTKPNFIEYEPFLTEPHTNTPILDVNQAPTSNSGVDQAVHDQVTLNGTGSFDPDGSIVSYDWSLQHRTNSANDRTASGENPTVYDLSPGFYDVYLTVTDNGGLVDTDNMLLAVAGSCFCTPNTFHIEMIEPDLFKADKGAKHGQAIVKVLDDCGNAVSGATVYGIFSGDLAELINGQTGGDGNVLLTTTTSTKGKPAFTFCVDDVINGTLSYTPADNVETCDSY